MNTDNNVSSGMHMNGNNFWRYVELYSCPPENIVAGKAMAGFFSSVRAETSASHVSVR